MDEKYDADKIDEGMLPGFRFHPTDEELVGFYLKRKIQQRSLPIELIKQLDIYKFDPWDLPKLATSGEKEWYFYCPRDRKYRNSARPNRVTSAGFWKATGTDRPIYSSEGTKCIGLKKSLVFYRGRAAKGIKTDWMMHEFRLPSISNSNSTKRLTDKNQPPNDSWALCRIFKKIPSIMQKSLSHSWVSLLPTETTKSDIPTNCTKLSSENISCVTQAGPAIQYCNNSTNDLQQYSSITSFFTLDNTSYKSNDSTVYKPTLFPINPSAEIPTGFMLSSLDMLGPTPSMLGDTTKISQSIDVTGMQPINGSSITFPQEMQLGSLGMGEETCLQKNQHILNIVNSQLDQDVRSFEFPFSLPYNSLPEAWKHNFSWDSPPCSNELSTCYSTNKSYT